MKTKTFIIKVLFYVIMNMSRKLAYNKKGNIQFREVECLPNKLPYGTY